MMSLSHLVGMTVISSAEDLCKRFGLTSFNLYLAFVFLMLSSPGDINVKKLAFTPYCGVGVVGGGGGGGNSSKHLP